RGVYRIHASSSTMGVLRTFRQNNVTTALLRQATILEYLARCGYSAPRPIMTLAHKPVSCYQDWSALFTTFIEGTNADFSYAHLTDLGACLGRLHKLSEQVMMGTTASSVQILPGSRFQLSSAIPYALSQLLPEAHRVPMEIWPLYRGLIATLHRIQQTINLPITLVHADSQPHHAIYTASGEMILTNWGSAGMGPAILDVSYLLLLSHLEKPECFPIRPNAQAIAAVVRGYCQQRELTDQEHAVLPDAVRFGIALSSAQQLPSILNGQWRKSTQLQTLQACYDVSTDIASLALHHFQQEATRAS
ncbi:MAG: phosphotransferase, partial [Ktedonobacteraceae bacterium]|nr:phosphotransferase [Ktedonobacteraceae bacterium]